MQKEWPHKRGATVAGFVTPVWLFILQMTGGSAAQSSTLQCLDAAFSVKHEPSK